MKLSKDFICLKCKWFNKGNNDIGCKAFPIDMESNIFNIITSALGRIPFEEIILNKHSEIIKGQIGKFIFEPIS